MQSKKTKLAAARKTAEALKAKKKEARMSKQTSQVAPSKGKGKSIIGQAKKKNK